MTYAAFSRIKLNFHFLHGTDCSNPTFTLSSIDKGFGGIFYRLMAEIRPWFAWREDGQRRRPRV